MSTFTKDNTTETNVRDDSASTRSEGARQVLGTIAVGLGSLEERLEIEAVDTFRARGAGPRIPPSFARKEKRSIGSTLRDFWHDETSLPIVKFDDSAEKERAAWRTAILSVAALAALMLLFLSKRGLLDLWIEKFLG